MARKKTHGNRYQSQPLNETTPTYRTPIDGRRLGGGANGGAASADELRRERLKAISRQQRIKNLDKKGLGQEPFQVNPCLNIIPVQSDETLAVESNDIEVFVHESLARFEGGYDALRILIDTMCKILKNAIDRHDRRTLRCANENVYQKVIRWRLGRELLEYSGFICSHVYPDSAAEESMVEDCNKWRENANFILSDDYQSALLSELCRLLLDYLQHVKSSQSTVSSTENFSNNKSRGDGSGGGNGGSSDGDISQRPSPVAPEVLVAFMEGLGFSCYTPALLSLGYDDISIWPLLTEDDFFEMCELAHMLPGHRAKLATALRAQAD